MSEQILQAIQQGKTALGIELGSTRIKSVLVGPDHLPIASGGFDWENQLVDGVWTYSLADVWSGLQASYRSLAQQVQARYGITLSTVGSIGISGMMHGYLPFNAACEQLVAFRTWRNTMTAQAAEALSDLFDFNIPQRWSVAHLYQAMRKQEPHVKDIAFLTTLAGYIHWQLTGKKVMGIGEASGMFPVENGDFHAGMLQQFDALAAPYGFSWTLRDILPQVLVAGENAGQLTEQGAALLDPSGSLAAGIPLCPPEGDAGTGMTATNSIGVRTGNVSAGTSIFAMVVLEKPLNARYEEIDLVTTPAGSPVAMVHCNNCTGDLDAWVHLLGELQAALGAPVEKGVLYDLLYTKALEGAADCGGLLAYNYLSGEHITGFSQGRPLFVRLPQVHFTLSNFARTLLFSAMASLRIGMDILTQKEQVRVEKLLGHGGLFKTPVAGQTLMAAAMQVPVTVMASAGEGGAWGVALLADYMQNKAPGQTLEDFLAAVFATQEGATIQPDAADMQGFAAFMRRYQAGLPIAQAAVECLQN